eukprot:6315098-Pyramimonas_sp.AAC.1
MAQATGRAAGRAIGRAAASWCRLEEIAAGAPPSHECKDGDPSVQDNTAVGVTTDVMGDASVVKAEWMVYDIGCWAGERVDRAVESAAYAHHRERGTSNVVR